MSRPSIRTLAGLYLRVGNQTFGSGSTTVVLLTKEMTERHWLTKWQCDLFVALASIVPGTNVLAFSAMSAHAVRGWRGATAALLAYTIPASLIVLALTAAYIRWNAHPLGGAAFTAAMSAIVGIIVGGAWLLVSPRMRSGDWVRTTALVLGAVVLSRYLSPLTIMAVGAAVGYFWPERQ